MEPAERIIEPLASRVARCSIAGKKPGVEWMLENESGHDDIVAPAFFDQMQGHGVVEYDADPWPFAPIRFPMPYTDCSMISATYTIPVEEARALLPDSLRYRPVRLTPRRSMITFFGYDFRRGALGPYRELGVAVPVVLDGRMTPPLLPAVLESRYPGFGVFIVELPVNHARPCYCGINTCGLPKVVGEADCSFEDSRGNLGISYEGKRMGDLRVEIGKPGSPRLERRTVSCLQTLGGRVVKSEFSTIGHGYRQRSGNAEFVPGDHPRFAKFHGLSLGKNPLELMVYKRFNWIIWAPQDLGPL